MVFKNLKKIIKTVNNKFLSLFVNKKKHVKEEINKEVKEEINKEVKKISKIKQLKK